MRFAARLKESVEQFEKCPKKSTFRERHDLMAPRRVSGSRTSYVFLAASDSSYFTGQVLHPNGGEVVNA
jgi:hypothetical protein